MTRPRPRVMSTVLPVKEKAVLARYRRYASQETTPAPAHQSAFCRFMEYLSSIQPMTVRERYRGPLPYRRNSHKNLTRRRRPYDGIPRHSDGTLRRSAGNGPRYAWRIPRRRRRKPRHRHGTLRQ
jgi:hypothetical protein